MIGYQARRVGWDVSNDLWNADLWTAICNERADQNTRSRSLSLSFFILSLSLSLCVYVSYDTNRMILPWNQRNYNLDALKDSKSVRLRKTVRTRHVRGTRFHIKYTYRKLSN